MQTESGREGRGVIRSEPVSLGGNQGEKGACPGDDMIWGVSGLSQHWMPSPWVLTKGKWAPWPVGGPVGRTGELWEAWTSPVKEQACAGLLPKRGREGGWKTVGAAFWFSAPVPARGPLRASEHARPARLTSQLHAGVRAATNQARAVLWNTEATQSQIGVRVGRGQPRLALTQAAHQKRAPIPDTDTTTAHTPVHSESPPRPL